MASPAPTADKADDPPQGICRQCAEAIPQSANLCRHCGSFQNWRRHLAFSSTVLALLVALLTVAGVAVPAIVGAIQGRDSNVSLSHPTVRDNVLYFVATNTGGRPGVIRQTLLASRYFGGGTEVRPVSETDTFVRPGSQQIRLRIEPKLSADDARRLAIRAMVDDLKNKTQPTVVIIEVKQARGRETSQHFQLTGEEAASVLAYHAKRCDAVEAPSYSNGCQGRIDVERKADEVAQKLEGSSKE